MKKLILFITTCIIAGGFQKTTAQNSATGLYLTLDDYLQHKLSYVTTGHDGNCIKLHNAFVTATVTVGINGKKQALLKSELFGYRDGNQDYRYFNDRAYRIVENKDLYLYSYNSLVFQNKGMKPVELYFFSTSLKDPVRRLSIENIESAFAANSKFKYMVESEFRSDDQLAAYDPYIKKYKIEYLFNESGK